MNVPKPAQKKATEGKEKDEKGQYGGIFEKHPWQDKGIAESPHDGFLEKRIEHNGRQKNEFFFVRDFQFQQHKYQEHEEKHLENPMVIRAENPFLNNVAAKSPVNPQLTCRDFPI